jgi:hypothetical protein
MEKVAERMGGVVNHPFAPLSKNDFIAASGPGFVKAVVIIDVVLGLSDDSGPDFVKAVCSQNR